MNMPTRSRSRTKTSLSAFAVVNWSANCELVDFLIVSGHSALYCEILGASFLVTDITKRANPHDGWTYEAHLARAMAWMMDKYDERRITLTVEEARKFEERASKAGFTIALIAAGTV